MADLHGNILIIDDDEMMCEVLSSAVGRMGHEVTYAVTLEDGLREAFSGAFDVVLLNVLMPDGNGLDTLPTIRATSSSPEVIVMTGVGKPDEAERAIKNGAWDYIEKPTLIEKLSRPFVRILRHRKEKKAGTPPLALRRDGIVGNSPQISICLNLLAQAANSEANVLICGETGTGKELFARAIHDNSFRSNRNFVVVDCASLPVSLVESVLFGYEKGAFTGADRAQDGLAKQADGGTLFLDEVGELPLSLQKAFLRVLQERRFRPLGGKREIDSNFRVVAATNRDLDMMVQQGMFRKDLLFRLRSFTIELPELRERPEDIKELSIYHMAKLSERYGTGTKDLSPEFLEALGEYEWPGNVRELVNTMERALASARHEPTLLPVHLPPNIRIHVARASFSKGAQAAKGPKEKTDHARGLPKMRDFREIAVANAEREYLRALISITKGSIKHACRISALSRPRLYALFKKYNISRQN